MNAAFLLVTTAWLAGANAPPATAVAAPAACGAACGACDCGACCCESGRPGLLARLKALCQKNNCCDTCCAPACPAPAPCCKPVCAASCCDDGCGRQGFFARLRCWCQSKKSCNDCCAPACCPAPVCKPTCCVVTCNTCCEQCQRQGLLARLRCWCQSKKSCNNCCDTCNTCYGGACGAPACGAPAAPGPRPEKIPAPKEPAKKMPTDEGRPISSIEPAPRTNLTSDTETKNPFELSRRYEHRVTHAADYSSLTGQLFYVHADGGLWVLRYAPLWQEDPNGGSMVLARGISMDSYHEGDLVTVQGEILSRRSSVFLGGPLYRVSAIGLVDR